MPQTVKAAVLRAAHSPLVIEDIEIADPGPREVVIKVAACGVCHSDLHFIEGAYPHPMPCVLGHEAAGVVEAVGENVTAVKVGDHVVTCFTAFCGRCEPCLTGHLTLCDGKATLRGKAEPPRLAEAGGGPMHQFLNLSGFAEKILTHENACTAVDPAMPLDRACLIGCAVITGYGAVAHTAQVRPGETVAVIGCGGVGLSAIDSARLAGAARIIAIDRLASKLEMAKSFGATDVIEADEGVDLVKTVKARTNGGVHHALECIGLKATVEQAFRMLRRGGTATVVGMIPMGVNVELHGPELLQEKKLQGSYMGSNRFPVDMPRLVDLYLQGRLKLDELVSRRIKLDEINEAFAAMKSGEVARSVVVFD
jgi:S-(hydroxymethyl)glutathione dehydrogenase/alcohol dehydrogenase